MKEDIKEILDIIKKVSKAEVNSYNGLIETPPMKWEILYDYITNLQEENEKLKLNHKQKMDIVKTQKAFYDYKSRIDKAIELIHKLLSEEFEVTDENSLDYGKKMQRAYFSDAELGKIENILNGGDDNE